MADDPFEFLANLISSFDGDKNESSSPTPENSPEPVVPDASEVLEDSVQDEVSDAPSFPALTDADFDRIFGEIAEDAKRDEEVIATASAVIEAEAYVAGIQKQHEVEKAEVEKYDAEVQALEKKLNELKRERQSHKDKVYDLSVEIRKGSRNADSKRILANQALKAFQAANEMQLLSDEWERRAKNFAWYNGITSDDGKTLKCLPHQWDAMRFMAAGQRVILGDKMGLGKTLSAIGTLDITDAKRILIVTPADITGNFLEEVQFWAGHRAALTIRGRSKIARQQMLGALSLLPAFVVVVNYEAWRRDHKLIETFMNLGFDTLICDEAHTIKETDTAAYKGIKEIAHAMNKCPWDGTILQDYKPCPVCGWHGESYYEEGLDQSESFWKCRSIKRVFLMSGTPILNKPHDLYALLSIIDPITFYNKNRFLETYAEFDYDTRQYVFAYGGVDRLIKRLSGRFLARSLEDAGIVLPPQKPILHQVELDPERYGKQIEIIEQISKYYEIYLDENRRIPMTAIIAMITRQRQANVWPGGISVKDPETGAVVWSVGEEITESIKLDKACELIKEFTANGERVAVFSQFSTALRELQSRVNLSKNDADETIFSVVYDGSTPKDVRDEVRRNFDRKNGETKKWDVVLANYKTGGQGLNLTGATHTIILDREWNPGKEDQALARTHRIGQTDTTFVHIIEIPGTIDEWMNTLISNKANMINGFNEGADELRDQLLQKLRSRRTPKNED